MLSETTNETQIFLKTINTQDCLNFIFSCQTYPQFTFCSLHSERKGASFLLLMLTNESERPTLLTYRWAFRTTGPVRRKRRRRRRHAHAHY